MKGKRKQKEHIFALLLTTLTFLLLLARILYIDLTQGDLVPKYRDPEINTEFYRGTIYAEDGNILAIDVPTYQIHFSGVPVREPARIASLIAPFTELDPLFIEGMLKANQGEPFEIPSILGSISRDEFYDLLEEENLWNLLSIRKTVERRYPFQEHGQYLIGRTYEGRGISGAEKEADDILMPPLAFSRPISKGQDITLPIDMELQYATETVLNKLLGRRSETFSILAVIDRNTLGVLALDGKLPNLNEKEFDILEKILGEDVTMLSTDEKRELPDELPSVIGGEYISHYLTERYLLLSISSDENVSKEALAILRALLETRNMI